MGNRASVPSEGSSHYLMLISPTAMSQEGIDNDDNDDDDDDTDDEDEEPFKEEEEEEHLAPADPSDDIYLTRGTYTIALKEEVERLLALPTPPPSPLISLSPPSAEERLARLIVHTTSLPQGGIPSEAETTPRKEGSHKGFSRTLDVEARHRVAEAVSYGIRDTWVDSRETVEEVAPVTLEGVNTRVTELAAVQEQDTQDIYAVIEDTQD
ncbi:hypothetical protein Tco_0576598 [Tanacetum coccineum]